MSCVGMSCYEDGFRLAGPASECSLRSKARIDALFEDSRYDFQLVIQSRLVLEFLIQFDKLFWLALQFLIQASKEVLYQTQITNYTSLH